MIPLFTCKACGFLSTRADAFSVIEGLRFDKGCIEKFEAGEEPVATWVREKLPSTESAAAAFHTEEAREPTTTGKET